MITLTRNGLTLSISEGLIPAQGSHNVPVKYLNDTDEYASYLITPLVGWTEQNGLCKSTIAEYSGGVIKLPARAFAQNGIAMIAIKMTDSSDSTHVEVTYPACFYVQSAPDGTLILPPNDEEWKKYIDDFITQYFMQNIDPKMETFQKEIINRQDIFERKTETDQHNFKSEINQNFDDFVARVDGKPDSIFRGYLIDTNNTYNGIASNDGINLGKVVGKSEQITTNGYQIFDASKLPTKSASGAAITNNGDGSFTITGSGNLTSNFVLTHVYSHEQTLELLKQGNLYLKQNGSSYPRAIVNLRKGNDTENWFSLSDLITQVNITDEMLQDSGCKLCIYMSGSNGQSIKSGTIKPMLYQDGDGTWESFSNGVASPSSDFPQEIKNVEITRLTSHAKNIINIDEIDKYYQSNNASTNTYKITGLLKNTNYTMSSDVPTTSPATIYFNGGNSEINGVSKNKPKTFKSTADGELIFYIRIDSQSGYKLQEFKNKKYYIQLELGDKATPYVAGDLSDISTNLTLRSLPNGVADTYENGVIIRRVGIEVFDGSSDELISEYNSTGYFVFTPKGIKHIGSTASGDAILADKLKRIPNVSEKDEMTCYQVNTSIVLFTTKYTTKTALKSFLSTNPFTFYYELATPTIEYYTVPTIPSYYPNTVVMHNSEVEPTEIEWHVETEKGLERINNNLLINGGLQVWQRGKTFEQTGGYLCSADRVFNVSSVFSGIRVEKVSDGLKITALKDCMGVLYAYTMGQSELVNVRGKTLTLSYSVDGVKHIFTADDVGEFGIQDDELRLRKSNNSSLTSRIVLIQYQMKTGDTKTLNWVKMEYGDVATPFVSKSYEQDLLDCLPYYQNLGNISASYIAETSAGQGKYMHYYMVQGRFHLPMIQIPSISYSKVGEPTSGVDTGKTANFSGRVTNEKIRSVQLSELDTHPLITIYDVVADAEIYPTQ